MRARRPGEALTTVFVLTPATIAVPTRPPTLTSCTPRTPCLAYRLPVATSSSVSTTIAIPSVGTAPAPGPAVLNTLQLALFWFALTTGEARGITVAVGFGT